MHLVQETAACTAIDASRHYMLVLMHIHDHASLLQLRVGSDQSCRMCWPTMMSVCLCQVPGVAMQHLERHVNLLSRLCDGQVANVILSTAAIMSTTSGLGKDIGIILILITLSSHSQAATSILAITKMWK